ncbi:MAG: NAD-dependent deacylase [Burkholderiales bacterium]|nr:MAG: NAD-dependent deacylase [Burkholderiales bacterium]
MTSPRNVTGDGLGLTEVRDRLKAARRVVVFTGAGVSAESGIPTFRDALTGLWARFDPERLATEAGFRADPALVWRWYAERRAAIGQTQPNAAHRAIAAWATRGAHVAVVTQNVDGLHGRAGSREVLELHGNILRARCLEGCGDPERIAPAYDWRADPRTPPPCPRCGAPLRPDVVWFGELLPPDVFERAERAALGCDLMLVVGTSALVHPAAGLPLLAHRAGARIVVVNPDDTPIDSLAANVLRGRAGDVLPALMDGLPGG